MAVTRYAGIRFAWMLLLPVLVGGCAVAASSERVVAERTRVDVAPAPSSLSYAALSDVARRADARLASDEAAGTFELQAGSRKVVVMPGVAAALVGSRLVVLRDEVMARYGRAYVPRALVPEIEAFLKGKSVEALARGSGGSSERPSTQGVRPRHVGRVCIDPGHGGKDPGAVSRWGLQEKEAVLSTAVMLATELRGRGFEVVMTRDDDTFIELNDRPAIAARQRADLFVAVHANSIRDSSFQGIEIFYPETQEGGGVGVRRQSVELAEAMRQGFAGAGLTVRKLQARDLRVLKLAEMPAVLVEIGYLTNRDEERDLRSRAHRQRLARAMAGGIALFRDVGK